MKNLFVPFTNGPINKRENPEWNRRAPINFYHLVLCFSFSWAWISMNQKSMVYTTIQYNASNKYSCIILYAKKTEMENKQNSNWIRWLLITVIIFVNLKVMARNLANGWKIFSLQNIPPGQRRPWLKWWLIFNAMLCFAFPIAISMKNDERSLCVYTYSAVQFQFYSFRTIPLSFDICRSLCESITQLFHIFPNVFVSFRFRFLHSFFTSIAKPKCF